MLTYQVLLNYKDKSLYPPCSWNQKSKPTETKILKKLLDFAKRHNIPENYLEEESIVIVDAEENGLYTEPDIYRIDFSRINK